MEPLRCDICGKTEGVRHYADEWLCPDHYPKAELHTGPLPELSPGLALARQLSFAPEARQARIDAWNAGKLWCEEDWLANVREKAADLYPDDQQLQYEYILGVAQTLNNLARDTIRLDYSDRNQPEGKKR